MPGRVKQTANRKSAKKNKKNKKNKNPPVAPAEAPENRSVRYTQRPVTPGAARAVFEELLIRHKPAKEPTYGELLIGALLTPQRALGYEVMEYAFVWVDAQDDLSSLLTTMRVTNKYTFPEVKINDARLFLQNQMYVDTLNWYGHQCRLHLQRASKTAVKGVYETVQEAPDASIWSPYLCKAIKFVREYAILNPLKVGSSPRAAARKKFMAEVIDQLGTMERVKDYKTFFPNFIKKQRLEAALRNLDLLSAESINTNTAGKIDRVRLIMTDLGKGNNGNIRDLWTRLQNWVRTLSSDCEYRGRVAWVLNMELDEQPDEREKRLEKEKAEQEKADRKRQREEKAAAKLVEQRRKKFKKAKKAEFKEKGCTRPEPGKLAPNMTYFDKEGDWVMLTATQDEIDDPDFDPESFEVILDYDDWETEACGDGPNAGSVENEKAGSNHTGDPSNNNGDDSSGSLTGKTSGDSDIITTSNPPADDSKLGEPKQPTPGATTRSNKCFFSPESPPKRDSDGRLVSIVDVPIIDLTNEVEEVRNSVATIHSKFVSNMYNSKKAGPKFVGNRVEAPKDGLWVKIKRYQYRKMRQLMENLSCDYGVDFKYSNIKKEPNAHKGAVLSGFLALPLEPHLNKNQLQEYANSFLPKIQAETFYNDMAALYYWIGKHTNTDKQQEQKFKKVKAALSNSQEYNDSDSNHLLLVFEELVDWKKANGQAFCF